MIRNTDADVESVSHDSCGSSSHTPSAGLLTVVGLAAVAGLYIWAACDIVAVSLHQINPDGVAYMRLARYWAEGRLDLAVSSYWGPLLSWLLVPSAWLGLAFKGHPTCCSTFASVCRPRRGACHGEFPSF